MQDESLKRGTVKDMWLVCICLNRYKTAVHFYK